MRTFCGESTENKQMIAATGKEDPKWSGKKMEGDEGLNTVECLRGRLLAERQASRVAKEEAESMGNKLVELEKKLRDEIKLRENAGRKLKILKKKLESLNISSISGGSEQSYSSEKCGNSCRSSASSSSSGDSEATETKPLTTNPAASENAMHNVSEASEPIQTQNSASIAKDNDSQGTDDSSRYSNPGHSFHQNLCENPNPNSQDLKNDESRLSSPSSKSALNDSNSQGAVGCSSYLNPSHSSPENLCHNPNQSSESEDLKYDESRVSSLSSKSSVTENEDDDGDFIDNSLALVPVNLPAKSQARNLKPVNESAIEVLDALRHAREKLLGSMGTRRMIKVGPTLVLTLR